jgi:thiol-disulfide isomerase/thioredoxin
MRRLRYALWAVIAAWLAAFAVVLALHEGASVPLIGAGAAATVADASVRIVPTATGGRVAALAAIEPGGASGRIEIAHGGVTMLDFFASWCHACKTDLKAMNAYAALSGREGLPSLVGVDLRIAEPSTSYVRRFLVAERVRFPVALDATGKVTDAYAVGTLPTVILVAAGGRVLWRHTGIVSLATLVRAARAKA